MSREDPQMKIRLPADLKDQIEASAKESGRSMNAEIVARLEGSFELRQPANNGDLVLDMYLAAVRNELSTLDMRGQLVHMRVDALMQRYQSLERETAVSKEDLSAMTHAEIDQFEAKLSEFHQLDSELKTAQKELLGLRSQRAALSKQVQSLEALASKKASMLREALSAHQRTAKTTSTDH